MTIIYYTLIARDYDVLVDAQSKVANRDVAVAARKVLAELKTSPKTALQLTSLRESNYLFNFHRVGPILFMCTADESFGVDMPYVYLQDISKVFMHEYPEPQHEPASTFDHFHSILQLYQSKYSQSQTRAKVLEKHEQTKKQFGKIEQNLDKCQAMMRNNIEKVIERGDALDNLMTKTDNMRMNSEGFKRQSRRLKRNQCWAEIKLKFFMFLFIMLVMYGMMASFCGILLDEC